MRVGVRAAHPKGTAMFPGALRLPHALLLRLAACLAWALVTGARRGQSHRPPNWGRSLHAPSPAPGGSGWDPGTSRDSLALLKSLPACQRHSRQLRPCPPAHAPASGLPAQVLFCGWGPSHACVQGVKATPDPGLPRVLWVWEEAVALSATPLTGCLDQLGTDGGGWTPTDSGRDTGK